MCAGCGHWTTGRKPRKWCECGTCCTQTVGDFGPRAGHGKKATALTKLYEELVAFVPQTTKVAKEATTVAKLPRHQERNSRKPSRPCEERQTKVRQRSWPSTDMTKKKVQAPRWTLDDLEAKAGKIEERRKVACPEITHAPKLCRHHPDLSQLQWSKVWIPTMKTCVCWRPKRKVSHLQNGGKCQPEPKPWGDKAMEDASRTLLGGTLIWAGSRVNGERNHHALSAKASTGRPQAEGSCVVPMTAFDQWDSQNVSGRP